MVPVWLLRGCYSKWHGNIGQWISNRVLKAQLRLWKPREGAARAGRGSVSCWAQIEGFWWETNGAHSSSKSGQDANSIHRAEGKMGSHDLLSINGSPATPNPIAPGCSRAGPGARYPCVPSNVHLGSGTEARWPQTTAAAPDRSQTFQVYGRAT